MSKRYIDVDELCRRLTDCWHTNDTEKGKNIQAVIDRIIVPIVVGTPTADVVEVKHGRNLIDTPSLYECSVCGWCCWDTYTGDSDVYNYCPGCGAKMDEEELQHD